MGRKAEGRVEQKEAAPKPVNDAPGGLSKEKQKLIAKLGKENEQLARDPSEDPDSSVATSQSTTVQSSHGPSVPVPDFTSQVPEQENPQNELEESSSSVEPETPIPALQSPTKPTPSIADRFSSTARSYRAPAEIATITIGDHTVTSSVGTPCPKRPRIENPPSTSRNRGASQAPGTALPSFGSILSQKFAAPGTAVQPPSSSEDEDEETQDVAELHLILEDSLEELGDAGRSELGEDEAASPDLELPILKDEEDWDASTIAPDGEEEEFLDDDAKKAQEEAKVEGMIQDAEKAALLPSQDNARRAQSLVKGGSKKKDATLNLVKVVNTDTITIGQQFRALEEKLSTYKTSSKSEDEALDSAEAEEKLSLTISKTDFAKMRIIGQFNLGFILASRASQSTSEDGPPSADDLFIIDQHASDEKYNFERLYATTIVQSQPLVQPKSLELTALEEEIVMENLSALQTNGFIVTVDESGESPVGQRCQVISLPTSRETTFSLNDLAELIAVLPDHPPGTVPRPSKVRKMFAMRACRSSIMIGKTLTHQQMGKVVTHLGELDKPWNCPHGRPTMRHLCGLGVWDELGWKEGLESENENTGTDWAAYIRQNRGDPDSPEALEDDIED